MAERKKRLERNRDLAYNLHFKPQIEDDVAKIKKEYHDKLFNYEFMEDPNSIYATGGILRYINKKKKEKLMTGILIKIKKDENNNVKYFILKVASNFWRILAKNHYIFYRDPTDMAHGSSLDADNYSTIKVIKLDD